MPKPYPEDAFTGYSRRFYDGTYTWDTSGFTDGSGMYREFDCMDPEARAPTPLPPVFDDDDGEEEEHGEQEGGKLSNELERELFGTSVRESSAYASDELQGWEGKAVRDGRGEILNGPDCFQFASRDSIVSVSRDELFVGRRNRDRLVAKLEGVVFAYKLLGMNLSLEDCSKLCETELSKDKPYKREPSISTKGDEIMIDTLEKPSIAIQMQIPRKEESGSPPDHKKDNPRVSSGSSGLSDVPSDLSAQSPSNKNAPKPPSKSTKNQKQEEAEEKEEPKDDDKPLRKTAARGIAQKVRKSTRKATATKAKPAKKAGPSTSLAALHSGTYRRSARQESKLGTGM